MKKLLAIILAVTAVFSACMALTACDGGQTPPPPAHEHSFSTQWTKDENNHWHDCQGVGCSEKSDLGAHDWAGKGELTCTVCGATKQDDFSGEVTEEQWNLATIAEKFNNVTIKYEFVQNQMGLVKSEMLIDGDKVLKKNADPVMNIGYTGEQGKAQKDLVLNLFLGLIEKYENFTYNAEDGTYASTETITTTVTDDVAGYSATETLTNGKVKFASDYTIEWLTCDMTEEIYADGQLVHAETYEDMLFTFTNFGTTVVDFATEVPYIPQNTYTQVTEEQWKASMRIEYDCEIKQTLTMLANGEFYYVMEDGYIRSGNVIKFADWYISIEGDKYFEYNSNSEGKWIREEIEEDDYIRMATFAELIDAYDKATFDAETGLYICDKLEIDGGYTTYYNLKLGFVDGKVEYVYYEDESEGGMKPVYQCYFDYKTVEVTLPDVKSTLKISVWSKEGEWVSEKELDAIKTALVAKLSEEGYDINKIDIEYVVSEKTKVADLGAEVNEDGEFDLIIGCGKNVTTGGGVECAEKGTMTFKDATDTEIDVTDRYAALLDQYNNLAVICYEFLVNA